MSSILNDTKKILNLGSDYDAFDLDIIQHINAAFSILEQLGIGSPDGFYITDDQDKWSDLNLPKKWENMVRTYVQLRARMLFDPPTLSFMITAMEDQLKEYEWRLSNFRELEIGA